ncbi:MAG: methyltransferase family protein [Candidatus Helarchaeota archaeon]
METSITIAWLNFIIFNVLGFFLTYFYILSLMPVTRQEKRGEKAWKECMIYRNIGGIIEFVMIFNAILWIWYPISELNWIIHENYWIGIIIGICITIPCLIILQKGVKDAGSETLKPSKDTKLYGGIYKYIRHPQTVGEFPLFIALSFMINSLFLVIWSAIFIVIIIPIIMHYEEMDLEKRFGDAYLEYKRNTGAFIPKFWKKKSS